MSLLEARKTYKPFEYPWAYEFWKRQQQVHWLPEEVPLADDIKDWRLNLSDGERNLLFLKGAVPGAGDGLVLINKI
mgnify:CR=1 FL=1